MEGGWKKMLFFGTVFILVEVTQTGSSTREFILITDLEMSWVEAQSYCRGYYDDLATISDDEDNGMIYKIGWYTPFWIGLYDDVNSWKWSLEVKRSDTGEVQEYRPWQEGQPDNDGGAEHCVSMTAEGLWKDNSCKLVQLPAICFSEGGTDQYVLMTREMSWVKAKKMCGTLYTDLVSVRSPSENQEIQSRLQGKAVPEAWIGLHRDSWKWSDGSTSSFRRWREQEPDNENKPEACVSVHAGYWNDLKCKSSFNFLCQNVREVTEPTSISPVVQRRTTVKMTLLTNSDLKDPTIQNQLLQQFVAALNSQGLTDVKLLWRTLRKEPQPTERDADRCGQNIL